MQIRELKEKASAFYARGKFRKSRELYEAALVKDPTDAQLHLKLADCCRKIGDVQSAARFFEKAAAILFRAGHVGRAHAALRLALELKPRDQYLLSLKAEMEATRTPRPQPLMTAAVEARLDSAMASAQPASGNVARALSLEIPIIFETPNDEVSEEIDLSDDFFDDVEHVEVSEPPIGEAPVQPAFIRISDHSIAVRTGAAWTVFKSATVIRDEELSEAELAARLEQSK